MHFLKMCYFDLYIPTTSFQDVEALLSELESLQQKLHSQEDDFRLQNSTLMQELSKVSFLKPKVVSNIWGKSGKKLWNVLLWGYFPRLGRASYLQEITYMGSSLFYLCDVRCSGYHFPNKQWTTITPETWHPRAGRGYLSGWHERETNCIFCDKLRKTRTLLQTMNVRRVRTMNHCVFASKLL